MFLRFPYFNPGAAVFREPLARLAAGERREIPLGRLLGYAQWGLTAGVDATWPPSAPVTVRDGELSATSGAVGAASPPGRVFFRLPEQTLPITGGGSMTIGGRLYFRAVRDGLDTLSTLGYETWWRTSLPAAGDVAPDNALPASQGSVGVFLKITPVRIVLTWLLLLTVVGLIAALIAALGALGALALGGPILVPIPSP